MIPVQQTTLGAPGGNCFEACIASVLELPIEAVPYFGETGWWENCQAFLAERGFAYLEWDVEQCGDWRPSDCYWIGAIDVGPHGHSVVYHGDDLVWNPCPGWTLARTLAYGYPLTKVGVLVLRDMGAMLRGRELAAAA